MIRAVLIGAMQGKTLARIFFQEALRRYAAPLRGNALDIAGGASPSYMHLLPEGLTVTKTNRTEAAGVQAVDMNAPLPYPDASFDAVFLFNALYIAEHPEMLASEMRRILKFGGTCLILSPFIANEMPEPHDYERFTAEGLKRLLQNAGFSQIQIERLGDRGSAAAHLMTPFYLVRFVRAIFYVKALISDAIIPKRVKELHPAPLSYFVVARI